MGTDKVLQGVRTKVSSVDCIRAARTNVASGNDGRHTAGTNVGQL